MKILRSCFLSSVVIWILTGCTTNDPVEEEMPTEATYRIMLFNHAGHSPRCGGPLTVRFEFTSDKETRILEQGPDTRQSFTIAIDTGTVLNVKAYNVANDNLLVQSDRVFYPIGKNDLGDERPPQIVLCPSDQLNFVNFR